MINGAMKITRGRASKPALALAVATILSNAAVAADQASSTSLEEIIVTAERREQSLQDIPVSATVLTGDMLAQQGVDNIIEIQQVAPSVAINTYNRGTFINIRGVGIAQSAPTSTPGVATYIDGVYIPHETFISYSFYDIASIEVLRGPQGTLTGQNSTGGAIYMRTTAPVLNDFAGTVDLTAADYSWYRAVGSVNLPMGSMVAARISAVYDTRDSFTKNIGPSPSQPGSSDLKSARASILIQPLDTLRLDLRYEYFKYESDYNAVKNRFDAVTRDPFTIEEDAESFLNQDGYRASLEARWDIAPDLQLRAITSDQHADNEDQADGDRTATAPPIPGNLSANTANSLIYPGRVGYTQQTTDTRVTELNLLTTGDQSLQWVIGAFYMTEEIPVQVLRDNRNTRDFVASSSSVIASADNESLSGFADLGWRASDQWEFNAGARYSEDTQDYTRFALPAGPPRPCTLPCTTTAESTETTGRVGAKFHANDDTLFYATVSRGYKAGGVNLEPAAPNFQPERNTVEELGFKSTVADGRLRVNGAVFYSDYDGIQVSALVSGLPSAINAAPSEIYGAELELQGKFDALSFNMGASWLHSETKEAKTMTDSSVLPSQERVVPAGTELPFSPTLTANAGVEYAARIGDTTLTPRIQASYIGEQWATFFHDPVRTRVPSRTVTDVRLTWQPMEQLRVEGFVTNVFDKTYIAVQVQEASSASGGYIYGAPRQVGGRIVYNF